jgi:hypothetical protein
MLQLCDFDDIEGLLHHDRVKEGAMVRLTSEARTNMSQGAHSTLIAVLLGAPGRGDGMTSLN